MAQEEQTQKCSNSTESGGGGVGSNGSRSSSKRQKPKKVPQRGLGVAQLEKIRLEEQQRKDAAAAAAILPSPTNEFPYLSLPIPAYRPSVPNHQSFAPSDHTSNSIFRPPAASATSAQNDEVFSSNFSIEKDHHQQSSWVDPGYALIRSNFGSNLSYESDPSWPLPSGLVHRTQPFYHQQPSSSVVNVSSSTSSSSLLSLQTEPPSNQSNYPDFSPLWPEEKIIGMKRPNPFSLENQISAGTSFPYKHPAAIAHFPINKTEEIASSCHESTFHFDPPTNPYLREGTSYSPTIPQMNSKKSRKEMNAASLNGDLLTLAPPPTASKLQDFEPSPYQGCSEDSVITRQGPSGLNQHQPYYSFFPQEVVQNGSQARTSKNTCAYNEGEVEESVDLNLKL